MLKFNKDFNVKIISILIAVSFLFNSTVYGIDLPRNTPPDKLRVPVGNSYERMLKVMRHTNELGKDAFTLPEEIFGVRGINLIDVFNEAWTYLCKDYDFPAGKHAILRMRGSINYATDDKGRLIWSDISDVDVSIYTDDLPVWLMEGFEEIFYGSYLKKVLEQKGIKIYKGVTQCIVIGQIEGNEKQWQIAPYESIISSEALIRVWKSFVREGGFDRYLYDPRGNFFLLCAEGKTEAADLSHLLPDLPLDLFINILIREYQSLFGNAISFFRSSNGKSYKRLAFLSKFFDDDELRLSLLREFREARKKAKIIGYSKEEIRIDEAASNYANIVVDGIIKAEGLDCIKDESLIMKIWYDAYRSKIKDPAEDTFVCYADKFNLDEAQIRQVITKYIARKFNIPQQALVGIIGHPIRGTL